MGTTPRPRCTIASRNDYILGTFRPRHILPTSHRWPNIPFDHNHHTPFVHQADKHPHLHRHPIHNCSDRRVVRITHRLRQYRVRIPRGIRSTQTIRHRCKIGIVARSHCRHVRFLVRLRIDHMRPLANRPTQGHIGFVFATQHIRHCQHSARRLLRKHNDVRRVHKDCCTARHIHHFDTFVKSHTWCVPPKQRSPAHPFHNVERLLDRIVLYPVCIQIGSRVPYSALPGHTPCQVGMLNRGSSLNSQTLDARKVDTESRKCRERDHLGIDLHTHRPLGDMHHLRILPRPRMAPMHPSIRSAHSAYLPRYRRRPVRHLDKAQYSCKHHCYRVDCDRIRRKVATLCSRGWTRHTFESGSHHNQERRPCTQPHTSRHIGYRCIDRWCRPGGDSSARVRHNAVLGYRQRNGFLLVDILAEQPRYLSDRDGRPSSNQSAQHCRHSGTAAAESIYKCVSCVQCKPSSLCCVRGSVYLDKT